MRRSACWLAILGLAAPDVMANDPFHPSTVQPRAAAQSVELGTRSPIETSGSPEAQTPNSQFFSGATGKDQLVPSRFTRSRRDESDSRAETSPPADPSGPSSELHNYYNELFGAADEDKQPATPERSRTRLKPVAEAQPDKPAQTPRAAVFDEPTPSPFEQESSDGHGTQQPSKTANSQTEMPAGRISFPAGSLRESSSQAELSPAGVIEGFGPVKAAVGDDSGETGAVIHARHERDESADEETEIELTGGESGFARPFPGNQGVTRENSPQPRSRTSLTEPISVTPDQGRNITAEGAAPQDSAGKRSQSKVAAAEEKPAESAASDSPIQRTGSLTISRGRQLPVMELRPSARVSELAPSTTPPSSSDVETGPQSPAVTIEWRKQSDVNVGQEFRCDLSVKNTGTSPAREVEIETRFPKNVRLVNAEPLPSQSESFLGWDIDELQPGEERGIQITMIPLERGEITPRADVRFSGTAQASFSVAEPLLTVDVVGPETVHVGEPASHVVTVKNPGTGIARNVKLEAMIPEGLEHSRGGRLAMELGALNPGESRSVRLALAAVKGGRHQIQVRANADSGLARSADAEIQVIAPKLSTSVDGPGLRYLGRQGVFTLTVSNDGAAPTDNVRVMHKIPEGFEFVSTDRGAQYDPGTRLLNWFVGRLEEGKSAEIKVTLQASQLGEFTHYVRATSEHGSLSDTQMVTQVEGASSLSVEITDLDDPVEVGAEAIYEVRVSNNGSAPARQVGLACELPPGMTFISAKGPSAHVAEKGNVVFRTIPELKPGETTVYRVHVTSGNAGHLRFRTRLSSDSIPEPLTTEELTRFYGDN
jgi:uncharacterized repeat protein (TIGR01451 family)